jgi:hypothetical protein
MKERYLELLTGLSSLAARHSHFLVVQLKKSKGKKKAKSGEAQQLGFCIEKEQLSENLCAYQQAHHASQSCVNI